MNITVTELIRKLQKFEEEHGDLEVFVNTEDLGENPVLDVEFSPTIDEWIEEWDEDDSDPVLKEYKIPACCVIQA